MTNSKQLRRFFLIYQCVQEQKFPSKTEIGAYLTENFDLEVSSRTLDRDIAAMRYNFHIWPEYDQEKKGYYFKKEDLSAATGALRFLELAYLTDNLNNKDYAKYISYGEAYLFKGIEHVPRLLDAIHSQKVISFEHENYQKGTKKATLLEPYLIREYLNRWYVVGYKVDTHELRTFGVDRMSKLIKTKDAFERKDSQKLHDLFKHVVGVVYDTDELITLEFKAPIGQKKYLDSLPLHESQVCTHHNDEEVFYQITVVPNYELEQKLLMHAIFITVTGPKTYAQHFAEKIKNIHERYERQAMT